MCLDIFVEESYGKAKCQFDGNWDGCLFVGVRGVPNSGSWSVVPYNDYCTWKFFVIMSMPTWKISLQINIHIT